MAFTYYILVTAALRLIGSLNVWNWGPEGLFGSSLDPLGGALAPPVGAWGSGRGSENSINFCENVRFPN